MKRKHTSLILFALLMTLVLSACGTAPEISDTIQQPLLQFPGTEWNMTPEEVCVALSVRDTERMDHAQTLGQAHNAFGIEGRKFLGEEAVILFEFYDTTGSRQGLRQVCVFFPEDADPDVLLQRLTGLLGDGVTPNGKDTVIWTSEALCSDFLPEGSSTAGYEIPAVHITLHRSSSTYSPQYLLPPGADEETGIVLQFYANHHALLQLEVPT